MDVFSLLEKNDLTIAPCCRGVQTASEAGKIRAWTHLISLKSVHFPSLALGGLMHAVYTQHCTCARL